MTGTELATMPQKLEYARTLADGNLLPRQYYKQPANVLIAIEYGDALGIPPMQAINSIHVIEGKPTASADLLASLVRRAGHKLRIREEATEHGPVVTATLIRADDPDFEFTSCWDRTKAKAAGLSGKGNWSKYEGQMMRARAITEVCRMGASDALYGVIYTPEELGAGTPPERVTVTQQQPTPDPAPTNVDAAMEALRGMAEPMLSTEQTTTIGGLVKQAGLTKRQALDFAVEAVGDPLTSATDLTETEAAAVIAALTELVAAEAAVAESLADPDTGEVYEAELVPDAEQEATA
ncbi:hypothetical protein ACTQ4Z_09740 [Anaerovoracaceae bacterium Sow4_D4]